MSDRTKYAILTMDVESFSEVDCFKRTKVECEFDMYDGLENFIELLERNGVPSTLFVVSNTLHVLRNRLREYTKLGHRVALHGFNHTPPYHTSDEKFRQTTIWARDHLEDALGIRVKGYRAPYFGLDRSKLDILREMNFCYDSSQMDFAHATKNCILDLRDFNQIGSNIFEKDGFYEFQVGCHKLFGQNYPISGGAYLRLCLWNLMRVALKQHLRDCDLYVFYVHPFELSQKKLPGYRKMSITDKMYLNYGRMSYRDRLNEIIQMLRVEGFQFTTFEDLYKKLEREKASSAIQMRTE